MSYVFDKKFLLDPTITTQVICNNILDILASSFSNFPESSTSNDSSALGAEVLSPPPLPTSIDDEYSSLAGSWMNELSSHISDKDTLYSNRPQSNLLSSNKGEDAKIDIQDIFHGQDLYTSIFNNCTQIFPTPNESSNFPNTTFVASHSSETAEEILTPMHFFKSTMAGYYIEPQSNLPDEPLSKKVLKKLKKYLSFTMPSLNQLLLTFFDKSPCLSVYDFCFTSTCMQETSFIKSFWTYIICFHMLIFKPISRDLKSSLIPLMETIKSDSGSAVDFENFQYSFPMQFSIIYNIELTRTSSSSNPTSLHIDPQFRLFINPLISICLKSKHTSVTNSHTDSITSSTKSKASTSSVFLEHSDSTIILNHQKDYDKKMNFSAQLEELCCNDSSIAYPVYDFVNQGIDSFTLSCNWLGKIFLGDGQTKAQAKENASKTALEFYFEKENFDKSKKFRDISHLKNLDSIEILEDDIEIKDPSQPSFSPPRESKYSATPLFQDDSNGHIPFPPFSTSLPPNSEQLLMYSNYFWNLYQQSIKTAHKPPQAITLANPTSTHLDPNYFFRTGVVDSEVVSSADGLLTFFPSIMPALNNNRKYTSLLLEYCQQYRMDLPVFTISSHTAPFTGRCEWLGRTFYTGSSSTLNVRIFHSKKSDAKEELSKMAIAYLLFSNKIGDNILLQFKVPELVPFLNKAYIAESYLKQDFNRSINNDPRDKQEVAGLKSDRKNMKTSEFQAHSNNNNNNNNRHYNRHQGRDIKHSKTFESQYRGASKNERRCSSNRRPELSHNPRRSFKHINGSKPYKDSDLGPTGPNISGEFKKAKNS